MFFFLKLNTPYIDQRQMPFSKLSRSALPFLSIRRSASGPEPGPAPSGHPSPLTWQFYHLTVGNFTTYLAASPHPQNLKPTCLYPLDIRHIYAIIITPTPIAALPQEK